MTPPATFTIGKGVLLPKDDAARDALLAHPVSTEVEVDLLDPNDTRLRNKIFAVIGKLAKWRGVPIEEMRTQVLIGMGAAKYVTKYNGAQCWALPSMDRRALQGDELLRFWKELCRWLESEKVRITLPHDLAVELSIMIGEP